MTNAKNNSEVNETVRQILSELKIFVSETAEGSYTVYTESEPLFCFERSSVEELKKLVDDTLTSYLQNFHQLDVTVKTINTPIEEPLIPVETIRPVSQLVPSINAVG